MSKILDQILEHKQTEVAERKALYPIKLLEQSCYFSSPVVSLKSYLSRATQLGIIAEIKRRSPSKGDINKHISIEQLAVGYMQAGASALSVLTDKKFFGGSVEDLREARRFNLCPILRKDFIIDQYQIIEARSYGADVVLLIAAALSPTQCHELARFACSLGLEVLLEVHSKEELQAYMCDEVTVVGVNSRDLQTFNINSSLFEELVRYIPPSKKAVAESGISKADTLIHLKRLGFHGFLIGEAFMRHARPEHACAQFIEQAERLRA